MKKIIPTIYILTVLDGINIYNEEQKRFYTIFW